MISKRQFFIGILLAAFLGGVLAAGSVQFFKNEGEGNATFYADQTARFTSLLKDTDYTVPEGLNFVSSAELVTPAVVHVVSSVSRTRSSGPESQVPEFWEEFFGLREGERGQQPMPRGFGAQTGSGVIISNDGYIVTNNHVIENASNVKITLSNNKRYDAKVIGADPNTDIALLKVEAKGLPYLKLANSDNVRIGEWVLAVGNPFDLNSTVTAGIVSAKARNINILRSENNLSIESFIQTDAVVNPGNSGGALVNLAGELIGINTAIATRTGTFNGYSFAVPSSIVGKVVEDLKEYGVVQRALLGVRIVDLSADIEEEFNEDFDSYNGVYLVEINPGSAAEEAGLKKGDIVKKIEGKAVNSTAELQEAIAQKRPGDKIVVEFLRKGSPEKVNLTLKSMEGDTKIIKKAVPLVVEAGGATFEEVPAAIKQRLELEGGAIINSLKAENWVESGIKEGFIITYIGETEIKTPEDVKSALQKANGKVMVLGLYPNGQKVYYPVIF